MKSHELRPQPSVVINQSFYAPQAPSPRAVADQPADSRDVRLSAFVNHPCTKAALEKYRRIQKRHGGRSKGDDLDVLITLIYQSLAHITEMERMFFRDWNYCDAEDLKMQDYWERMMTAPLPRRKA